MQNLLLRELMIGLKMVSLVHSMFIVFLYLFFLLSDGSGYYEDGREIFDDEDNEIDEREAKKRDKTKKSENHKKRLRDVNKPVEGNASIRSLFNNATTKKRDVKINEDDILTNILGEIDSKDSQANGNTGNSLHNDVKPSKSIMRMNEKIEVKKYMESFAESYRKPETKIDSTSDDVRLSRFQKKKTNIDKFLIISNNLRKCWNVF